MAVHFKFRSAVDYDSINLDDHFISVRNLKQRIVEHKNLASNRTIDFDLVIEDSQTGEAYLDDNYLVPRNTSVIIKRVPAAKKPFYQAFDLPKPPMKQNLPPVPPPAPAPRMEVEGDDFGVDLFAAPAPPPPMKSDEDAKIMEMVSKSTLEWQRFDNNNMHGNNNSGFHPLRGGRGRGRGSGPPPGYVCHRCGQPGHFIQQCPTNGDPNYDIKKVRLPVGIPRTRLRIDQEGSYVLPDGSVAAMQPDENLFAKEADALMAVKAATEVPPELRCPLCRSTFKEAVMIPCCHYSFCDKCIRQSLMTKGQCPQCGSVRFKNDDLLPNIALRQAIEKFMESQMTSAPVDQGATVPDGDSASQQIVAPSESKHSADDNVDAGKLRDTSSGVVIADSSVASKTDASLHPVIPKDASGSVNPEGNVPGRENGDGGKSSEPLVLKGAEDIALESEVSKGKKKKKRARGANAGEGGDTGTTNTKGERYCYQCGSPGHLAKDCVESMGSYPPHPGMFPGGSFPMGPYPGPDMFWHGPPVPFAPGYGDGMYGPGMGGMPMPPGGGYQMPPCMPPPYPGVPPMAWFADHPGMMNGDMKFHGDDHSRRDHRGEYKPSHGRTSDSRDRNGTTDRHHHSDADYGSRGYSDKYRDDKYKYSERRRTDKERRSTTPLDERRKSERETTEDRNGGGSYEYRREKDKEGPREKQYSRDKTSSADYEVGRERRHSEHGHKEEDYEAGGRKYPEYKEERRSKFSSKPPPEMEAGSRSEKEKRIDYHVEKESHGSRSRGHERDGEYSSDEAAKRKKRRSREVEERSYSSSKYSDDHSRRHSEDDHSRWKPDYYDDERYRDERKHSSSSSRHHRR